MWILSLFPEFVPHLIFAAGIIILLVAIFMGMIPIVNKYKVPGQIAGLIILCAGLWLEGGLAYKQKVDNDIKDMQLKLKDAQIEAANTNLKLEQGFQHDVQVVHDKGQTIIKYLQTDPAMQHADNDCKVSPEVIDAHNRATGLIIPPTSGKSAKANSVSLGIFLR
jgi:hypothetical protein